MNYFKKANSFKKSLNKNSVYAETGNYIVGANLRYAYKNEDETIKFINNVLLKNNSGLEKKKNIKSLIRSLLEPRAISLKSEGLSKDFEGTIFLFSNDTNIEKDLKIFDIKRNQILTSYTKIESLEKKIADYNYFSLYFSIPEIISYDIEQRTSIEQLIVTKPKHMWDGTDYSSVIDAIFSTYKKYYESFSSNDCKRFGIDDILLQLKDDLLLRELVCKIEKEITSNRILDKIPVVNQHGDLWLFNTMIDEKKSVYFIDWEHSGEYFLFYDLFWWMQNEALYNDNFSYIENYINGKYDHYFKGIFYELKYEFDSKFRKDYLYIFILELLYKRILNNSENIKRPANDLFSKLFVKIQNVKTV